MSHALQSTSAKIEKTQSEPEFVWPEYRPSSAHRKFLERLYRARIERGLSIADMTDEVGLTFRLANEFETLAAPLPFCHLELWCQVVGVPFADYLAIYFADERKWAEREAQEHKAPQNPPCITNTESGEAGPTEAPALAIASPNRAFSFLFFLRAAVAHISSRFLSLFSTPKEKPE